MYLSPYYPLQLKHPILYKYGILYWSQWRGDVRDWCLRLEGMWVARNEIIVMLFWISLLQCEFLFVPLHWALELMYRIEL